MEFPRNYAAFSRREKYRGRYQPGLEGLERRRLLATTPVPSASSGSVAVADFNGDGKPDLVTFGPGANLLVSINTGPPTSFGGSQFAPPVTIPLDGTPTALSVADFNGDGKPDLAVGTMYAANSVEILLGQGDGTFRAAGRVDPKGADAITRVAIAVADFSGDGKLDIAVASSSFSTSSVTIYDGAGDGTFAAVGHVLGGGGGDSLATGDFNGDKRPDLLIGSGGSVPDQVTNPNAPVGTVREWLNRGDGDLSSTLLASPDQSPGVRLVVADFNNDGKDDFALTSSINHSPVYYFLNQNQLEVFLGNGDGTFRSGPSTTVGPYGFELVAGDFNGDGHTDLAAAESFGIDLLLGAGDGSFSPPVVYAPSTTGLAVGDFNGDHKIDIAVAASPPAPGDSGTRVAVIAGRGDGTMASLASYPLAVLTDTAPPLPDALASFGPVKVVSGVPGQEVGYGGLLVGPSPGSKGAPQFVPFGNPPAQPTASGDFNGDGIPDLLVEGTHSLSIFFGRRDGTFAAPVDTAVDNTWIGFPFLVADLSGDGRSDVVARLGTKDITILESDAQGRLHVAQTIQLPSADRFADSFQTGDFNNDHVTDLALMSVSGNISILLGRRTGGFAPPVDYHTSLSYGFLSPPADLNGDGQLDLVITSMTKMCVVYGRGDGTFGAPKQILVPVDKYFPYFDATETAMADVNGDGKLDLVFLGNIGSLNVALNQGDGTFPVVMTRNDALGTRSLTMTQIGSNHQPAAILVRQGGGGTAVSFLTASDLVQGTFKTQALSAYSNVDFSGSLAQFTPSQIGSGPQIPTAASLSGYTATIDWGDGTTSAGTIKASGTPGEFVVAGSHRYAKAGIHSARVALQSIAPYTSLVTITDQVTVTNAPVTSDGRTFDATEGAAFTGVAVAQFTAPGHAPAAMNPVTIDWGDGTTSTGNIRPVAPGSSVFAVYGGHTFVAPGAYSIRVTFRDDVGRSSTVVASASVAARPFVVTGEWSAGSASTSNNPPAFRGTSDPKSTVQLFAWRVGTPYRSAFRSAIGKTMANAKGEWSLTTAALPRGTYRIIAQAVNRSGVFTAFNVLHQAGGSSTLFVSRPKLAVLSMVRHR